MGGVELWVPGRPVPKGRPRMTRRGRVFTPERTLIAEQTIADATCHLEPITGPVEVHMEFYVDGTWIEVHETEAQPSALRGDLDNYVKTVLDGLQKDGDGTSGFGLIPNDRLVVALSADMSK